MPCQTSGVIITHQMPLRFLLVLLLIPCVLEADTYPRQTGVDAIHYVFRLSLGDTSNEIVGETTVTVKFLLDRVGDVELDLTSASASAPSRGLARWASGPHRADLARWGRKQTSVACGRRVRGARPGLGCHRFHARQQHG